jgi:hypothetical protein
MTWCCRACNLQPLPIGYSGIQAVFGIVLMTALEKRVSLLQYDAYDYEVLRKYVICLLSRNLRRWASVWRIAILYEMNVLYCAVALRSKWLGLVH